MSSRYVWNRNSLAAQETDQVSGSGYSNHSLMNFDPADKFWGWTTSSSSSSYYVITNGPIITNSSTAGSPYRISNGKFVVNSPTRYTLTSSTLVYEHNGWTPIVVADEVTSWNVYFGINQSGSNSYDRLYHVTMRNTGYQVPNQFRIELTVDNTGHSTEMALDMSGMDDFAYTGSILRLAQGALVGTISNATSNAYPPQNNRAKIDIICTIIPLLLRRCSRG